VARKQKRVKSPVMQHHATQLRHAGNLPEALLWSALRGRRFADFKCSIRSGVSSWISTVLLRNWLLNWTE
jgi:very-short-patch-repair endonuclease